MAKIKITNHSEEPSGNGGGYRRYKFSGTYNNKPLIVITEDGQYDYETIPDGVDDDEPIQIAIGEYMEANAIDPGICHR